MTGEGIQSVLKYSILTGNRFTPNRTKGSSKYGKGGNCTAGTFEKFNLTEGRKTFLSEIMNHSLSKSTWSTYKTAERMLLTCRKEEKRRMELPLTEEDIVIFISWLIEKRNLKSTTINGYLSGLKQLHVTKGMEPPIIRTSIVTSLLKGKTNMDNIHTRKEEGPRRLPMTMTMMRLLKETIREWEEGIMTKLLMWAICTIAFHGAFRMHELLCKTETEYDPDFTLLAEDVKVRTEGGGSSGKYLEIKLKCPKESKSGKAVIVEVYESKGTLCPVKAFERWATRTRIELGYPLFRNEGGVPITGAKLNKWMENRLGKHINYKKGKFSSHSFRSGLATTMGTKGFSEEDIKEAGRWSSTAYEVYVKLPRRKREGVAKKIGKLE